MNLVVIGGVLASIWGYVRAVIGWLSGLFVVTVHLNHQAAEAMISYMVREGRHMSRNKAYTMRNFRIKSLNREYPVVWEALEQASWVLWVGWRPLWMRYNFEAEKRGEHTFPVSYIRGTVNIERLLIEVADWKGAFGDASKSVLIRHRYHYHHGRTLGEEMAERQNGRTRDPELGDYRYSFGKGDACRVLKWDPAEVGVGPESAALSDLVLTAELQQAAAEVRRWLNSRDWYERRLIAWRRGFLLHGRPGTGKTSFVRAIGEEMDLPVHVFDIGTMSNEDLRGAWVKMSSDVPCIALIEDIDRVFKGSENVAKSGSTMMSSGGLSFDALLNCIDGVERLDGILLMVTTNHLELVDEAMTNRAGRIDRVIETRVPDFEGRLKIAVRILGKGSKAAQLAHECDTMTAANFVERCCREALQDHYQGEGPYR